MEILHLTLVGQKLVKSEVHAHDTEFWLGMRYEPGEKEINFIY